MRHLLMGISLLVALSESVSALECIVIPLKTSVAESEIVLLGQVEGVRYPPDQKYPNGGTHYVATVRVQELWKGSTPAVIELSQPFTGGGMALDQNVGSTYLFFVRRLTPQRPMNHPFLVVTSGYSAHECITRRFHEQLRNDLGKSYPPG